MKSFFKKTVSLLLASVLILSVASCGKTENAEGLWSDATYTEDEVFAGGNTTEFTVKVTAGKKSVRFFIHTDKETLGDALMEHNLISGEKGAYGLYVKTVNGIYADYDTTNSYWAVNKDGEAMITGVDSEKVEEDSTYEFIYTKN